MKQLFAPALLLPLVACAAAEQAAKDGRDWFFGPDEASANTPTENATVIAPPWSEHASPLTLTIARSVPPLIPLVNPDKPKSGLKNPDRPSSLSSRVSFEIAEEGGAVVKLIGAEDVLKPQDKEQFYWCWAAAAQAVNRYHNPGVTNAKWVDQGEIAEYFETIDETKKSGARYVTIARAIVPELEPALNAMIFTGQASIGVASADDVVDALLDGEMAIMGHHFHAYVVVGAHYSIMPSGQAAGLYEWAKEHQLFRAFTGSEARTVDAGVKYVPRYAIHSLSVYDPATDKDRIVTFDYAKFERETESNRETDFFLTRKVATELLAGDGVVKRENALDQ